MVAETFSPIYFDLPWLSPQAWVYTYISMIKTLSFLEDILMLSQSAKRQSAKWQVAKNYSLITLRRLCSHK